jgi:hypothetical protein
MIKTWHCYINNINIGFMRPWLGGVACNRSRGSAHDRKQRYIALNMFCAAASQLFHYVVQKNNASIDQLS